MTSFTLSWTPLEGDPPFDDKPCKNKVFDTSHGAQNTCEFPLPEAIGYGILQVFCKKCRHLNNIMMTGGEGDFTGYKVGCRKVRDVEMVNKQLELL